MSDYGTREQPAPTGEGREVWPLVAEGVERVHRQFPYEGWALLVEDMRQRDALGRERYGTPLRTHNGRDALADAYQELLDAAVYLRQTMCEGGDQKDGLAIEAYDAALMAALKVRRLLLQRDGR